MKAPPVAAEMSMGVVETLRLACMSAATSRLAVSVVDPDIVSGRAGDRAPARISSHSNSNSSAARTWVPQMK